MRIIAVIPARLSSKRLPGKVLKKINKDSLIEIIHKKLSKIFQKKNVFVITSNQKSDSKIFNFCNKKNIRVFRGSLNNVFSRTLKIGNLLNADGILRVNGDSPLIINREIKKSLKIFKTKKYDLVTNIFPRSYPIGMSIEIIKTKVMNRVSKKILKKSHKEHITKYFYDNFKFFKIFNIKRKKNYSNVHLAVDTMEDFNKVKKIFLKIKDKNFTFTRIIDEYKKN